MRRQLIAASAAAVLAIGLGGWPSPASSNSLSSMSLTGLLSSAGLFKQLGGMRKVESLASRFVSSSLKDPQLAGLIAGKSIDPASTSGKVSTQLCAMLGGGCRAPLTKAQVASAASTVSPQQATAISQHFRSSLRSIVSNPAVRAAVLKALGGKLPGVLAGFL